MDFSLSSDQVRLQKIGRELATRFSESAARHDGEASAPHENYQLLREAGLYGLLVPKELGGMGAGLLGHTVFMEELAQGCSATAMSFNMHCVAAYTLTATEAFNMEVRKKVAHLIVEEQRLMANLISESGTTNLLYSTRASSTQARKVKGGYRLDGKKAFATMISSSDVALICVHPSVDKNPESVIMVIVSTDNPGLSIETV